MKAVIHHAYGAPEAVLSVQTVDTPVPKDDEVLVRVRAASMHPDVWHVIVGYPYTSLVSSVPRAYTSGPFVSLDIGKTLPPQLTVSGLVGQSYRLEYVTDLRSSNWQPLVTFPLSSGSSNWTDAQATNDQRFYRAVLLP